MAQVLLFIWRLVLHKKNLFFSQKAIYLTMEVDKEEESLTLSLKAREVTVTRMNSPPFKLLFEVERSLSLDTLKHWGYITELMRGDKSRFAHWLNALRIDLHTDTIETCQLRRISYIHLTSAHDCSKMYNKSGPQLW